MATRVFTEGELARLRGFPEISREELVRVFTLTPADVEFIDAGRGRGPADRFGLAVQLCTLPWLGFVPAEVASAPPAAVARLSERLQISVGELAGYGTREQTRSTHLQQVARYLGWRQAGTLEWKELDEFLLARAMEHDSPSLLFRLAREHLISSRVIRPGVVTLLEHVATARAAAERETHSRVAHLLTPALAGELDGLLLVDAGFGMTRLKWLTTPPVSDSPESIKTELAKLTFLRGMGAHTLDLSMLSAERRRFLTAVGRRLTAQSLDRREPQRRHPILLTLVAQSAVDVLDDLVALFDQAVSAREGRARRKLKDTLAERAVSLEDRQALLDEILPVLVDASIPDEDVGAMLRGGVGMDRLRAAVATARPPLPRDHGHLAMMDDSYTHLRQFTPQVLATIDFHGGTGTEPLLEAVDILRHLNATGARKVPEGAPADFVPTRWKGYLADAVAASGTTAYRHYWELVVLLCLRDGLRSGDIWVPGSRPYADPVSYLYTSGQWEAKRIEFCSLIGKSPHAREVLEVAENELATALTDLETVLDSGTGPGQVRLNDEGELVVPPLSAEDLPAEVAELRSELTERLPFATIASCGQCCAASTNPARTSVSKLA